MYRTANSWKRGKKKFSQSSKSKERGKRNHNQVWWLEFLKNWEEYVHLHILYYAALKNDDLYTSIQTGKAVHNILFKKVNKITEQFI